MSKVIRTFAIICLTYTLFTPLSGVSAAQEELTKNKKSSSSHVLGMVTASETGTYYRFGNDIKSAVGKDGVNVLVKPSTGSIANINRITSSENAALGIVQSDVLGFLMRSEEPKSKQLAQNLRMIFPFYQEEVHVVANKEIGKFKNLEGKTVVIGPNGSGSWLTAMNLFNLTGVRPTKLLRLTPEEGLIAVLKGRADAMIYVAGKPVKLFQNLENLMKNRNDDSLAKIHLLPLKNKKLLAEYASAKITSEDYAFVKKDIPTIAVTAVLVTFDFAGTESNYVKQRCEEIGKFSKSMMKRLGSLRETGHPKWQEVDLNANVGIWQRDKCSVADPGSSSIENELLNTLDIKW